MSSNKNIDTISQVVSLLAEDEDIKRIKIICSQRDLIYSTNSTRFFQAPFKVLWVVRSSSRVNNIRSIVRTIREDSSIQSPIAVLIDTEGLSTTETNIITNLNIPETYIVDTGGENRQEKLEVQLNRILDLVTPRSRTSASFYKPDDLAYEKIEQAWRDGSKKLNLSGMKLTELPKTIEKVTGLVELNLNDNELPGLPARFAQLQNFGHRAVERNPFHEIPEVLQQCSRLRDLYLYQTKLTNIPEWINQISSLVRIDISGNKITDLPDTFGELLHLKLLILGGSYGGNPLEVLPDCIRELKNVEALSIAGCKLKGLPDWIEELIQLQEIYIHENNLMNLPVTLVNLSQLQQMTLFANPLNPELNAAYEQGLDSIMAYLRAKATAQITLNEAKLILIGEGEVGKSCLLDALRGEPWQEHETTHGIQINQIHIKNLETGKDIILNGWDFGGQRVYRPTHQLFFSSPAVYLVVWKPREGPQQGFVKEWIKLVKHREPDAKILVVATHGGPQQRQPDIDRQDFWDLFGKDTVLDFFHVESKPDKKENRHGIKELKTAIASVAVNLPEMGRTVPKSWQDARTALQKTKKAYLPLEDVIKLCRKHKMDDEQAHLFVTVSHRLGHLIHYQHDPALRDIVVLKPDWLAAAISFVLDDIETRKAHGLVPFSRLRQLWDDPSRAADSRYPADLHLIFLRLMERFDLSYRVTDPFSKGEVDPVSLIAQLVPDTRPEKDLERELPPTVVAGDIQQVQICRIVDNKGQSATAEGLFYQLIVRLHKYSLGRVNYKESVHWQRGLVLDDGYNGRALLEHVGNDVHITVRAPYPGNFLAMLTSEIKYLVESFWEGLRCDVMVPCIEPCGKNAPGTGLFEVEKLIESKRKNRPEHPCPVCNEWQNIDYLLSNAPASRPMPAGELIDNPEILAELRNLRSLFFRQGSKANERFVKLDSGMRKLLSKSDASYIKLLESFTDEAKEGPRLFNFYPIDRSNFNLRKWTRTHFLLTLWCEHSRLPLPVLNGKDSKKGVYEIELTREWFKKAGPYLKLLTGTLSLVLPVASSAVKLALDEKAYKAIAEQLDFGQKVIAATIGTGAKIGEFMGAADTTTQEHGEALHAQGSNLRELHALLKAKDPGFGGLIRVMNKRQEFLWVHPQFEKEY